MKKLTLPPCGAYCEKCDAYKKTCAGCVETDGKPFFLKEMNLDICQVWQCVAEHKVEHCGICKEFPCDKFLNWYDPKRGIATSLRRAGLLALRKRIRNEAWVKWIKEKRVEFGV